MALFAKVVDSESNLVSTIEWKVVPDGSGQPKDRFVDSRGNIFFEQSHSGSVDGIALMQKLKEGADQFYEKAGLKILIGRQNEEE